MIVICPEERLQWIKGMLKGNLAKITKKLVRSVVGLLEFLAAVLPFLRAPLEDRLELKHVWKRLRLSLHSGSNANSLILKP